MRIGDEAEGGGFAADHVGARLGHADDEQRAAEAGGDPGCTRILGKRGKAGESGVVGLAEGKTKAEREAAIHEGVDADGLGGWTLVTGFFDNLILRCSGKARASKDARQRWALPGFNILRGSPAARTSG